MKKKEILAVIPARGGSKSIVNKNIVKINGKPLINYTIKAAIKSTFLTDVVVSTDSSKIAKVASKAGLKIPFLRPKHLSGDKVLSIQVVVHALKEMEKKNKKKYDYIVLLQPTSPLRSTKDIDLSLKKLTNSNANSLISVTEVGGNHPNRMKKIVKGKLVNYANLNFEDMRPRQVLPKIYIRNGSIYASKRKLILKNKVFAQTKSLAYVMPKERSINIDGILDLQLAKIYLKKKRKS